MKVEQPTDIAQRLMEECELAQFDECGRSRSGSQLATAAALVVVDEVVEILVHDLGHDETARHVADIYRQVRRQLWNIK